MALGCCVIYFLHKVYYIFINHIKNTIPECFAASEDVWGGRDALSEGQGAEEAVPWLPPCKVLLCYITHQIQSWQKLISVMKGKFS